MYLKPHFSRNSATSCCFIDSHIVIQHIITDNFSSSLNYLGKIILNVQSSISAKNGLGKIKN